MSLLSRVMSARLRLPAAQTRDVIVQKNLAVPMPDGTVLLADRYAPRDRDHLPLVLVRSPYGRKGVVAEMWAKPFAERGYQVLIQSVRGTFGSGGSFDPHHHEHADGLATLEWIKRQPWFGGSIVTFGQSYLGYVQWAIARDAGPELKAMAVQISTAHFANMTYSGGAFALRMSLGWARMVTHQEAPLAPLMAPYELGLLGDPLAAVWRKRPPLAEADVLAAGQRVAFLQDWLKYASPSDPWWRPMDFQRTLPEVTRPISMLAGWDDVFTPWQLQDFSILQDSGCDVRLTVGPWKHLDKEVNAYGIRDALTFFHAQLSGDRSQLSEKRVRVYVRGAEAWREYDRWPPREVQPERYYLQPGAALSPQLPAASAPDRYSYDPEHPTPSLGGPSLTFDSAIVDNRPLESRSDVLTYTSAALASDLEITGPVHAELWVSSDRETCDFFVRLCEVHADGRSKNVCDGLARIRFPELPAAIGGAHSVQVALWPTAHRFRKGHRLRVLIASGAYPRWSINPGSIAPLTVNARAVSQHQQIHHASDQPSAIVLPVIKQ